jgi:hypothetical protein
MSHMREVSALSCGIFEDTCMRDHDDNAIRIFVYFNSPQPIELHGIRDDFRAALSQETQS